MVPRGGRTEVVTGAPPAPGRREGPYAGRMTSGYLPETIDRAQADALPGLTVLQFGTDWCGYCRAAEPHIERALADVDGLTRILVEDGKGRALGRSYRVKLWPTLVFLVDGTEVARVVRPWSVDNLAPAVDELRAAAAGPEAG